MHGGKWQLSDKDKNKEKEKKELPTKKLIAVSFSQMKRTKEKKSEV